MALLPLHLAVSCSNCSSATVELLLEANTAAARATDQARRLPLHMALENNATTTKTLQLLVEAYPNSLAIPNPEGLTPLQAAGKKACFSTGGVMDHLRRMTRGKNELFSLAVVGAAALCLQIRTERPG